MYVLPIPQKMTVGENKVKVKAASLSADDPRISDFAGDLDRGGEFPVSFELCGCGVPERYRLTIDQNGVRIRYGDLEGAFRAYTTLKQILAQADENGEVNACEIEDQPAFRRRGYSLDISRGKIPKLESLKKLADRMAALKYNELQLYLDSFAVAYKHYPGYTADTQPLTLGEIKELHDYCKARFIHMVPNQNTFGHMHAWTAKPEIAPLAITGKDGKPSGTLNPLDPRSLEFVDSMLDGYVQLFDSDRCNIGMDETVELGMNETKEECDKKGVGAVYTEYLSKVCGLVTEKYGMAPMFWDDIIFKHPEQLDNVPENAIVMQWGYETEHHYDRNCRRISESGRRFYVCPGTSMWGSVTGRTNNAIVNITSAAENGALYGAEGFLLTEWGDDGHPQFPATAEFPFTLGAAVSWNCMSHDHEEAYDQRKKLIRTIKEYLDEFVYGAKGSGFADTVCRMGNFYLLEKELVFNGTQLWDILHKPERKESDHPYYYRRVYEYMSELRSRLAAIDADPAAKSRILVNCDTVLAFASVAADGKTEENGRELDRIIAEYKKLWLEENHEKGMEIFVRFLESLK
ncbi:MAG: family 20 glycosylhydrolase [Clostridia bacterium]|nr:family 20 glycosylhydrolase [Clostridia bacterium]